MIHEWDCKCGEEDINFEDHPFVCPGCGEDVREESPRRDDRAVANAARSLIKALDYTNPGWRLDTLHQPEDGDEVNAAWDALVNAIEGDSK